MRRPLAALAALLLLPAAAEAAEPTKYSLQGGCWSSPQVRGGEPLRLQATTLARYLLVRRDSSVVAVDGAGKLGTAAEPSDAADFEVVETPQGFTLVPESTRKPAATGVRFAPADGCAVFPEAPLNATGTPSRGDLPWGEVGGLLEGHMHWMAFEYFGRRFRCGRPWHPYGIEAALPDCADFEGPQGTAANFQNLLNYGNPAQPHSTENYPGFPNQAKDNLTYEGMYWRWIERVWMAGLRLMVMGVNENRVLCMATPNRQTTCNEMDTMRRGFQRMYELQDYIDAQAGGPGKGFLKIVKDPFEARRVINAGKMAVVLEIETSEPFDCIGWETVTCDKAQIDRQLEEMHRLGVRSALLLNKFDNPLSGVRFDSGTTGYLINSGNKVSSGTFFSARTCAKGALRDNTLPTTPADASATELQRAAGVPGGTAPTYPPAPHCNTRGLTELGRHTVKRMMDLGMIVNPDHMSQAAVDDTLTLLESRRYSGVISPHGWVDPGNWPRLWALGGMAFGGHAPTDAYAEEWRDFRPKETPFFFGWGYGADLGGLSRQPAPSAKGKISYPFKSYDGTVTFDKQKTGTRTFDYTDPDPKRNGVSTYGQYPEWFEDLRRVAGEGFAEDMWRGAEAYLQMWERASGIASKRCFFHKDGITRNGRGPIVLGDDSDSLLRKAGQPQQRGQAWSWCTKGPANTSAADVAVLDGAGKVVLVGSTAKERHARGGRVGYPSRRLRGTRDIGGGLRLKRDGARTFVYVVRGGVVRAIAVTTTRLAGDRRALRTAVRRVLEAKASAAERRFVPNDKQRGAKLLGHVRAHGHTHP